MFNPSRQSLVVIYNNIFGKICCLNVKAATYMLCVCVGVFARACVCEWLYEFVDVSFFKAVFNMPVIHFDKNSCLIIFFSNTL